MKASFPMTRAVGRTSQRTAILKLPKLPAFPFPAIATQSPVGEGEGGEDFTFGEIFQLKQKDKFKSIELVSF